MIRALTACGAVPWRSRAASDRMPLVRAEQLRAEIRAYIAQYEPEFLPDIALERAQASEEALLLVEIHDTTLTPLEGYLGLLAGMSPKTRRRIVRRWVAAGEPVPLCLRQELVLANNNGGGGDGSDAEDGDGPTTAELNGKERFGPRVSLGRQSLGHEWHGQRVVAAAKARGGEAELIGLCKRFRTAFVEALRPGFLPEGWDVGHAAVREFGACSVYATGTEQARE